MQEKTKEGYGLSEHIFNTRHGFPPETLMVEDFKHFSKKGTTLLRPYVEEESMAGISVSDADKKNGSPKIGDMIAQNKEDATDMWLVAENYFNDNYELVNSEGVSISKIQLKVAEELMVDILNDNGAINKQEPLNIDKRYQLIIAYECGSLGYEKAKEVMNNDNSNLAKAVNLFWVSIQ